MIISHLYMSHKGIYRSMLIAHIRSVLHARIQALPPFFTAHHTRASSPYSPQAAARPYLDRAEADAPRSLDALAAPDLALSAVPHHFVDKAVASSAAAAVGIAEARSSNTGH